MASEKRYVTEAEKNLEWEQIMNNEDLLVAKSSDLESLDIGLTRDDFFGDKIVGLSASNIADLINYSTIGRVDDLDFKSWVVDEKLGLVAKPTIKLPNGKIAELSDYEWTNIQNTYGEMPHHVKVKMLLRMYSDKLLSYEDIINMGLENKLIVDVVYMIKFGYEERETKMGILQKMIDAYKKVRKNSRG